MLKTQKVKIYPNKHMLEVIEGLFNYRRYIWNTSLSTWNDMYDEFKLMSQDDKKPNGTKVRNELVYNKYDWQYNFSSRVLQTTVLQLEKAWKNYFNPQMPNHMKPKFKSKKNYKPTFTTDTAKIKNNKLILDKPNSINKSLWYGIKFKDNLRFEGTLKLCTIKKQADGLFASLTFETDDNELLTTNNDICGIDVNVKRFNYNDGNKLIIYPKKLERYYQKITYYQKSLAKKRNVNKKNFRSVRYQKVKTKLGKLYQKVSYLQNDLLQKFTTQIISDYGEIHIEDLDVHGMMMSKKMGKNLHRSQFSKLSEILQYKCEWYGRKLILVDKLYPSTQICSECGFRKTKDTYGGKQTLMGDLIHHDHQKYYCYNCGAILDRDENAVQNLINYNEQTMELLK